MGVPLDLRTAATERARGWSPNGFSRNGLIEMQARFDPETFDFIKAFAKRRNISLAGAVRLLVEWGLEADRHD